jgi:hypothetical protein
VCFRFANHEDLDPTPRAPTEPFRFTPSLTPSVFMDPTSAAFSAFANQPPGLFTPTPGGNGVTGFASANPITANPMGTTQDTNIGISIEAPLNVSGLPAPTTIDTARFSAPQTIHPQQYYQPYTRPLHSQYLDPSRYDLRSPSGPGSPMDMSGDRDMINSLAMNCSINDPLDGILSMTTTLAPPMPLDEKQFSHISQLIPSSERQDITPSHPYHLTLICSRFRFNVVLNAPTAMIKHADEIPATYLNKGQSYAISIVDTQPSLQDSSPTVYRTFIRVSFHDETQRNRPAGCWQLWKEGRGINEAHQRGGKLQAVEYVENQHTGDDRKRKAKAVLESSYFDGFAVTWSPLVVGAVEASVSVRFNFLSTDFSHSKGVKGIPVRLCAKTEVISSGSKSPSELPSPEVCYCKVKLFRDHGAERKLSNDIMHVKKTIEKLKQQAGQVEGTGMKVFGKKPKKEEDTGKLGKAIKHKRTWSMSSASSVTGPRCQDDDTNARLKAMQDMFSSTRPVSVLYLRGESADDPDLYPVRLPGELDGEESWAVHRRASVATTNTTASSVLSPSPSSLSLSSRRCGSFSPEKDWEKNNAYHSLQNEVPVRVNTTNEDGMLSGWIEAVGVDASYKPPAEKPTKAAMCVYILPIFPDQSEKISYYRAVYLKNRSASCLSNSIAFKCGVDSSTIYRTVYINPRGLTVLLDDDLVSEMNEGQDMKVQLREIIDDLSSSISTTPQEGTYSNANSPDTNGGSRWELQLLF